MEKLTFENRVKLWSIVELEYELGELTRRIESDDVEYKKPIWQHRLNIVKAEIGFRKLIPITSKLCNMDNFEMPTPCQKCDEWFDLNDGVASHKWFRNTVICKQCGEEESEEIYRDEEIENLKNTVEDALVTLKDARNRLMELGVPIT